MHNPIHGHPDLVKKYTEKFAAMEKTEGPDFVLEPNPDHPNNPSQEELAAWLQREEFSPHKVLPKGTIKIRQKQDNIEFAAMVESVDESLGRILDRLSELGIEEDTIVIFSADNGGTAAMNVGNSKRVVEGVQVNKAYATSCLPLRGAKGWLYEGGIRVPMIVKWLSTGRREPLARRPYTALISIPRC